MSRVNHPRIPEQRLKPYFDAINANDHSKGFDVLLREEKNFPGHPYLLAYMVYSLAQLERWSELETHLNMIKTTNAAEIETFNILRFGLKKTKYMPLVTEMMDVAYKADPKRTDLLKLITMDQIRFANFKKLQSLSSILYTSTKENPYLVWAATALSLSLRQLLSRSNGNNDLLTDIVLPSTLKQNEENTPKKDNSQIILQKRLKSLQESTKSFALVEALLKRAFPLEPAATTTNPLMSLLQQQNNQVLKHPWFVQYLTLYTQQGLITTIITQMEKKIQSIDQQLQEQKQQQKCRKPIKTSFAPFYGLLDVQNIILTDNSVPNGGNNLISMELFLTMLPQMEAQDDFVLMNPTFIEKGLNLLHSPLSMDFKSKQPQQWRTLALQYTMHSLIALFQQQQQHPEPGQEQEQIISIDTIQQQIIHKINDAKQLCRDILTFWPDQWNIISLYVYLTILERTNGWYVFNVLNMVQNDPQNEHMTTIHTVLMNELKFVPHPMSLEPLYSQHNWYDILSTVFTTTSIPSCYDITNIAPISIDLIQEIKNELVGMWCVANTPQKVTEPSFHSPVPVPTTIGAKNTKDAKKGTTKTTTVPEAIAPPLVTSTDPSNFTGKYPSRGLLLSLLEVDRLALIFNANIYLRTLTLSSASVFTPAQIQTISTTWNACTIQQIQSILCTHFVQDAQLYSCAYIEKPYFMSDLQFHLNVFSTFHALALIHPHLGPFSSTFAPNLCAFEDEPEINTGSELFKLNPYAPHFQVQNDAEIGAIGETGETNETFPPLPTNFPIYHSLVLNFIHNKNKRSKIHYTFAIIVFNHHIHAMELNAEIETANAEAVKNGQKGRQMKPIVKVLTWFDVLLLFTNAFTYSYNTQFIVQDELTHIRRSFELDLQLQQAKSEDQPATTAAAVTTPQPKGQNNNSKASQKGSHKGGKTSGPSAISGKDTTTPIVSSKSSLLDENDEKKLKTILLTHTQSLEAILLRPEIITLPYLAMPIQRDTSKNASPPHTALTKHPEAPQDDQTRSTILHPSTLSAYTNSLTLAFAVHHEADLYLSKTTQIQLLFNGFNGQSLDKQRQTRFFFSFHQQYAVALQLLHSLHEHAQSTYAKQQEYQKQLQVYKATMNHLELPPPPTQPIIDETPAQLGILALFFLLDIFSIISLHTALAATLTTQSSSLLASFKPFQRFLLAYLPPQTQLQTAILSTLQYLQMTFPHEIQSQLLHFRLYSHPFGFNLLEIYRVFVQMSVKQIQWDTLAYLSPVLDGLNQLDLKISTILAKQVTQFHQDFAESDLTGYEQSFKLNNSFSTLSMAGLSERLLFSQTFMHSFITLSLNEAVFISPVKLNHNLLIVDQSVDIDYDLMDPEKYYAQQEAKKKKLEEDAAKKSAQMAKPVDKKAAIAAAAQAAAKNKGKKGNSGGNNNVDEKDGKKDMSKKQLTNPHLPLHLQSLQLIHTKTYQNMSANDIHIALDRKFAQLFTFFSTNTNKYLPTFLPHPSLDSNTIVSISNPLNFAQLLLFVSNRHTNNDMTSLQCPSLLPSFSTSIKTAPLNSSLFSSSNSILVHPPTISSLAQAVTPLPSTTPTNITTSHALLHPLLNVSAHQYQPSIAFAGPPTPTCLYRDNTTSATLYNEYYYSTDEQSLMLRLKYLYTILLYFFSSPSLYNKTFKGIFIPHCDNKVETITTSQLSTTISANSVDRHIDNEHGNDDNLIKWAANVPITAFKSMYSQTLSDYFSLLKSTLHSQYRLPGDSNETNNDLIKDQLKMIEFESNLMSLTSELVDLSSIVYSIPTHNPHSPESPEHDLTFIPTQIITSTRASHILKINEVIQSATQLLSIALGYFTPTQNNGQQMSSPDDFVEFTVSSLLHHHNYFERLVSLFTTYFVPLYILLAQRYQMTSSTSENNENDESGDNTSEVTGFYDIMAICITYQTWYQNNLTMLLELDKNPHFINFTKYLSCPNKATATTSSKKKDGSIVDYNSLVPALPSVNDKLQKQRQQTLLYELNLTPAIPLPRYLQAQQTLLVQHRLWNSYYTFESLIDTLYHSHAALYVPFSGIQVSTLSTSANKFTTTSKPTNTKPTILAAEFTLPIEVATQLARFKRTTHFTLGNLSHDGSNINTLEPSQPTSNPPSVVHNNTQISPTQHQNAGVFGINFDSMNTPLDLHADQALILQTLQQSFEKAARIDQFSKKPSKISPMSYSGAAEACSNDTSMTEATIISSENTTALSQDASDESDNGLIDEDGNLFWDYDHSN